MRKRGFYFTLIITAFLVSGASMNVTAFGGSLTNDKIKEDEKAKQEAEDQKKSLEEGLTGIQNILNSLEKKKNNLKDYVKELDKDLTQLDTKIEELKEMLGEKEKEVAQARELLEEAEEKEKRQYENMKLRIRFMYEQGAMTYQEMLLKSDSFVDFLNKAEFIKKVSAYDRKMLEDYEEAKVQVRKAKEILEEEQTLLDETKEQLDKDQQAVSKLIKAKEEEIKAYDSDIANKEQLILEYNNEIAAQNAEIEALEASIAAEKKRLEEENKAARTYDGGQFAWPAPSYTRISDDYGDRIHPTLGTKQFHNGIDLAAPNGSPILAAYDGTVVAASYSGTMGNYVMINHGDGLLTIYMHASKLLVSQGQEVSRGQQIANIGSTGRSTGPHLHFGVRKNGAYVSPWNYIR